MRVVLLALALMTTRCDAGNWDAYIDNLVEHSRGTIAQAAILGMDGGMWTSNSRSNSLRIENSADLASKIKRAFEGIGIHDITLSVNEVNYKISSVGDVQQFWRGDGPGKIKMFLNIVRTKTAYIVVVGELKDHATVGVANEAANILADYIAESLQM